MDIVEYEERMIEQEDWSPGFDEINDALQKLYHEQKPSHYAIKVEDRKLFGGTQYLDAYSIYNNQDHKHIITYGMTQLYADSLACGKAYSKWGYEMTIRLLTNNEEECMWALDLLANLARYTNTKEKGWFSEGHFISGNKKSLDQKSDSMITGLLFIQDPQLDAFEGVHGKVGFLQLVGITTNEVNAITEDINNIKVIIENMRSTNPLFITDMNRTFDYI